MNFLCHAVPYLRDNPLVAVMAGLPDWLSVVDRRVRIRRKMVDTMTDREGAIGLVARGVILHLDDDRWFHQTAAFAESNLRLAVELRDQMPGDRGFRPSFLGHVLIEVLLDAMELQDDPSLGERYYRAVESIDAAAVQSAVATITNKHVSGLPELLARFCRDRFLLDYEDDGRLHRRMNGLMRRVGLNPLPETLVQWYPVARRIVHQRRGELLCRWDKFRHA